jgi:hypothetical protein
VLDAAERGLYDIDGKLVVANANYIAGALQGGAPFTADVRNFFVFDLAGVSSNVTAATLRLWNPADDPATTTVNESGFRSTLPNPLPQDLRTETYQLNEVSTSIPELLAGNAGGGDPIAVARFDDLGDGNVFGTYIASNADNGTFVQIVLNAAAIAAINAHAGGLFAIGGSITSLDADATNTEALFRFTNGLPSSDTQLLLSTAPIPEPASYALMIAGLGIVAVAIRRCKRA